MRFLKLIYLLYERFLKRQLAPYQKPHHIGLIVDGNRRFALANRLSTRKAGHMAGSDRLEDFLAWCLELDVKIVTLYGFSTENYKRSNEEVEELMSVILNKFRTLQTNPLIDKENVRIKVIGRRDRFSSEENNKYIPPVDKALNLVLDDDRPLKIINAPENISAAIMLSLIHI